MKRFSPFLCGCLLLGLSVIGPAGCDRREDIQVYEQAKPQSATSQPEQPAADRFKHPAPVRPTEQTQLLGAVVPHEGKLWVFKISGPPQRVVRWQDPFFRFLRALAFDEKDQPVWQLPADWQQRPGDGMRFATIRLGTDEPPLEMAVMAMESPGESQDFTMQAVNMWRSQVGLPPLNEKDFQSQTMTIDIAGGQATFVNFISVPPREESAEPGSPDMPMTTAPASPPPKWTYTVPEGWTPLPAEGVRLAAFRLERDGLQGEMTVITMGPAGADMLMNVNRWREQLGLPEIDRATLDSKVEPIEVSGRPMQRITIIGIPDGDAYPAIVGVVGPIDDRAWAFTLKADHRLVELEKDRFLQFLQSIKIEPADRGGSE